MDAPFHVPEPLLHWLDVAGAATASTLVQGSASHRQESWPDLLAHPEVREMPLTVPSRWQVLDERHVGVPIAGRLLGGCLETLAMLPGTPYGDVTASADAYAPEGLLLYLEAAESDAATVARLLWHLRLAGWFDRATGVLVGRTAAPSKGSFTQLDAVRHALGDLGLPVLYDVDLGHVPPQLALVNGAAAVAELDAEGRGRLVQRLV